MKLYLLFIVLLFHIDLIVGRSSKSKKYRADYTYHKRLQGWIRFNEIPEKWERARLRCFLEGSTLATPTSKDFTNVMTDAMRSSEQIIFLGMSAIYSDGDFYSVEGSPLSQMSNAWAPGEPNNFDDEQCIGMYANGTLADVSCTTPLPYICFRKETENPSYLGQCGTIDPEYIFETRTEHCYKVHHLGQTWSEAFMTCSAEGGYLAIVNSEEEQNVLKDLMKKYPESKISATYTDPFSIGFNDWSENRGVFMTIHGQTLKKAGFEKWADNQPNNLPPGQPCGSIYRNGLLNDIWCNVTVPFICEKVPWSLQENNRSSEENISTDIDESLNIIERGRD